MLKISRPRAKQLFSLFLVTVILSTINGLLHIDLIRKKLGFLDPRTLDLKVMMVFHFLNMFAAVFFVYMLFTSEIQLSYVLLYGIAINLTILPVMILKIILLKYNDPTNLFLSIANLLGDISLPMVWACMMVFLFKNTKTHKITVVQQDTIDKFSIEDDIETFESEFFLLGENIRKNCSKYSTIDYKFTKTEIDALRQDSKNVQDAIKLSNEAFKEKRDISRIFLVHLLNVCFMAVPIYLAIMSFKKDDTYRKWTIIVELVSGFFISFLYRLFDSKFLDRRPIFINKTRQRKITISLKRNWQLEME